MYITKVVIYPNARPQARTFGATFAEVDKSTYQLDKRTYPN